MGSFTVISAGKLDSTYTILLLVHNQLMRRTMRASRHPQDPILP